MISNLSQVVLATTFTADWEPMKNSSSPAPAQNVYPVQDAAVTGEPVPSNAFAGKQAIEVDKVLAAAVDHLNANVQNLSRNLEFSVDKDSGDLVIKVVDAKTNELVRQIPREEALALARNIKQYENDHQVNLLRTKA